MQPQIWSGTDFPYQCLIDPLVFRRGQRLIADIKFTLSGGLSSLRVQPL